jgi:hypothetical protein
VLKAVCYTAALLVLLVAAFGVGLYAGAERTPLFDLVKGIKLQVQALAKEETVPPPTSPDRRDFVRLYDAASIADAQANDTPPADYLEWAGFYRIANSEKDLEGLRPLNAWLPPVIGARLQPWAKAKMETTDGIADDTGAICQPTGVIRTTGYTGSFLWLPGPDKIVMAYGAIETAGVQRIYMNRTHPRNLRPTWNGDSIGYWEGDTLVIDTIGFNDKSWLASTMEPHTEELRWIQRVRRIRDGRYLEIHYTVEDRKALTSAYTYTRYYKRVGDRMPEEICNDDLQVWREYRNEALAAQWQRAREIRTDE